MEKIGSFKDFIEEKGIEENKESLEMYFDLLGALRKQIAAERGITLDELHETRFI